MAAHSSHAMQRAIAALLMALSLSGCKVTPVDRSFDIPNWCEPYGCPKGGSGV